MKTIDRTIQQLSTDLKRKYNFSFLGFSSHDFNSSNESQTFKLPLKITACQSQLTSANGFRFSM